MYVVSSFKHGGHLCIYLTPTCRMAPHSPLSVERVPARPNRRDGNSSQRRRAVVTTTTASARWRQDQPKPSYATSPHHRLVAACQKLTRLQLASWIQLAGLRAETQGEATGFSESFV
jgi:hypothetical protein